MTTKQAKLFTWQYLSLLVSTFFGYVGFQMLVPTLTTYITQLGGSNFSASLAYSAAAAAALLARLGCGSKLDSIGRKPLLLMGLVILMAINIILFFSQNVSAICALRLIHGIGWGIMSTALATMISDVVPVSRRGEGIGYFSLSIALATSLSIILGIYVMNAASFPAPLLVSTLCFVLCTALCAKQPAIPFLKNLDVKHGFINNARDSFEKTAFFPAFLCFLHSVAFSGIMAFIMLFGRESGITHIWIYFVGHLGIIMLTRPAVGMIFDRKGHAILVIPGVAFMIVGLVVLSFAQSVTPLVLASICYGLGYGAVQPSLQTWAINRSPADRKGAANGTFLSSFDLGYAAGTLIMGTIASLTNYAIMFRLSPVFLILFAVIYGAALIRLKTRQPSAVNA